MVKAALGKIAPRWPRHSKRPSPIPTAISSSLIPAIWSTSDLEPYLLSGAYIGEHNFEVYTDLAGMSEEEIAVGMGDGLFE